MKILIVDDSKLSKKLLKNILHKLNHEVIAEGSNGQEAIDLYFSKKPDIVLMDIIMPKVSGLEALEAIMSKDPCAKVVICSSMGQKDYIIQAIMLGAREFVVKPFVIERIQEVLDKLKA